MKNLMKAAALTVAGLMLTGCTLTTPVQTSETEIIIEPVSENSSTEISISEEPSVQSEDAITDVKFEVVPNLDNGLMSGKLTWKRGTVDCFYCSPQTGITELEVVQDIGPVGDNMYYFVSGTKLYMIDLTTGENIGPEDTNVGASCSWAFDENNTIYICGYYGPALDIIGADGKIIANYPEISENIWPYDLRYEDGFVYITYEQEPQILKINPDDGSFTVHEQIEY